MTEVVCQKCGATLDYRDAVFLGPPAAVTWLCKECAATHQVMRSVAGVSGLRRPIPDAPLIAPSNWEQPELVNKVQTDAVDLHRLRFELAHVVKYFDEHALPPGLMDWHKTVKELLRRTNPGERWVVEE